MRATTSVAASSAGDRQNHDSQQRTGDDDQIKLRPIESRACFERGHFAGGIGNIEVQCLPESERERKQQDDPARLEQGAYRTRSGQAGGWLGG